MIRVHREKEFPFDIDRQQYAQLMIRNLLVLRAQFGPSQTELANILGVTRQTLSAVESDAQELTWGNFVSLLHVFTQNEESISLMEALGIYTPELTSLFRVTIITWLNLPYDSTLREMLSKTCYQATQENPDATKQY